VYRIKKLKKFPRSNKGWKDGWMGGWMNGWIGICHDSELIPPISKAPISIHVRFILVISFFHIPVGLQMFPKLSSALSVFFQFSLNLRPTQCKDCDGENRKITK
jgi:hypothetical protein